MIEQNSTLEYKKTSFVNNRKTTDNVLNGLRTNGGEGVEVPEKCL